MEQETTFIYKYSARETKEIEEIRRKYLPREESKLEELKRLDNTVQRSGIVESLCTGIGGSLVFGVGMCLAMEVIGGGTYLMALGVFLGICGMAGMFAAYPVYRRIFGRTKEKLTPRILALTAELSGEKLNS
ncbi:MAG: hypothetical protein IJ325_04870 [Clostridia bacterium]|nr:hypothetical protein [Clostridia bacterium]